MVSGWLRSARRAFAAASIQDAAYPPFGTESVDVSEVAGRDEALSDEAPSDERRLSRRN